MEYGTRCKLLIQNYLPCVLRLMTLIPLPQFQQIYWCEERMKNIAQQTSTQSANDVDQNQLQHKNQDVIFSRENQDSVSKNSDLNVHILGTLKINQNKKNSHGILLTWTRNCWLWCNFHIVNSLGQVLVSKVRVLSSDTVK